MKRNVTALLLGIIPLLLVAVQWGTADVLPNYFVYDVPVVYYFSFLETHYLYFYLHIVTLVPVFLLSFDQKVAFYKRWKFLWQPLLMVNMVYWIWDIGKTSLQVWGFNSKYIVGCFIFNLPIEEIVFFITVPYACVFIYYCLLAYFPTQRWMKVEQFTTPILILGFIGMGLLRWDLTYTSTTCIIAGFYLLFHYLQEDAWIRARFYEAFIVCLIPFLIIDGVLTGGYQSEPIILYNPNEFLNIRIGSIPIEDAIYFIPYLLFIVTYMEKKRCQKNIEK
ncbi:MAG: lycopene cyclase domain-containing protein [Cytophagaceae bacterium]|jgi:lycopene cyclase domain-containing protein|nr:lycopene cyclase domain-containing protein [Cytophagaceae bacterium]